MALLIPDWNSLDSVRSAHALLELWSIWLFAGLVVCDVVAHLIEDKRKNAAKIFERVGLALFAVAVFAELAAYKYGQRNDELSEGVIRSLASTSGQAATDSQTAITNAGKAEITAAGSEKKAEAADTASKSAVEQAGELSTKLNAANAEIDELQKQRAELEKSLAPRTLPYPNKAELEKLKFLSGTKVILRYVPDAEAERTASILNGLLKLAGWKLVEAIPDPSKNDPSFDGVVVESWESPDWGSLPATGAQRFAMINDLMAKQRKSHETSDQLVDFLISHGWVATSRRGIAGDSPNPDTLIITVGFKPNQYFDPEQIKQTAAKMEQLRKQLLKMEEEDKEREKKFQSTPPLPMPK